VEALYQHLQKQGDWDRATRWQELINDYFLEADIGADGQWAFGKPWC
jgi:hypothetical protein